MDGYAAGLRSMRSSSSLSAWLLLRGPQLLALVVALGALLVPGRALAWAPMCDEDAQSIEAPVPLRLADDSAIRPGKGCDSAREKASIAPLAPESQHHHLAAAPGILRALPVQFVLPKIPGLEHVPIRAPARDGARAACLRPPFRPPLG